MTQECSPISSQLSALLFSSPPLQVAKQPKLECPSFVLDEDDLEELLLKELEEEDNEIVTVKWDKENFGILNTVVAVDKVKSVHSTQVPTLNTLAPSAHNISDPIDPIAHISKLSFSPALIDDSLSFSLPSSIPQVATQIATQGPKSISTTLAYCDVKESSSSFSPIDSIIDERGLPVIDFSTPQLQSSQRPTIKGEIKTLSQQNQTQQNQTQKSQSQKCIARLMVPGNFKIEDLQWNIRAIGKNLHMNPIEAIKQSDEKRISFLLAFMLRDYRQIGSTAQLRFLDGSGNEIIGTMPFSACEKEMKLTYGLILVLNDVTVFKTPGGTKYLNITKRNITAFYNNIKIIE